MKWVYRLLVLATALTIFGVTLYVNLKGIYRGSPALAPFAPFMNAGLYALGMYMCTENIEKYHWKIAMANVTLFFALAIMFTL